MIQDKTKTPVPGRAVSRRLVPLGWMQLVASALTLIPACGAAAAMPTCDQALQRLMDGNARFVAGEASQATHDAARRTEVAGGQQPFAILLCCADSRVGPEIVFDQGLGDIFVVRVAGNILNNAVVGSIEYAAGHFGSPLIVVLGHEHCGAVSAAVEGGHAPGHIHSIVEALRPAVDGAKGQPGDPVDNAVCANVRLIVERLRTTGPILRELVATDKLRVVGARYDLDTGRVELLSPLVHLSARIQP